MGCLLALLPAAGHDQMWLLYTADLVRHGAKLYGPELFESNPPLIVWLSIVPSGLGAWLRVPATALGKLLVCGVGLAVAAACIRLIRGMLEMSRTADWTLGFVYVAAFLVMPARDFGQRDHLLGFLCLPYLLSAARVLAGRPLSGWPAWIVGLGLGTALKPHQVLIPISVELTLLLVRRRESMLVRPELLGMVTAGMLYAGAIWLFSPEYVTRMLPLLGETYWAFGHLSWWQLVREAVQLHILAAAVLCAAGFMPPVSPITLVLAVAGVAATVAYYVQRTGWYYQQLPACMALAVLGVELGERRQWCLPSWTQPATIGLCGLAVLLTAHFMGYPFTSERSFPIDTPDPSLFAGLTPGTPVATLTTTVDYTIPPVFKYHLTLAQRYPHLWMLPAILRSEPGERPLPPERLTALEEFQHEAMLEEFMRWHPQLVSVERCQDPAVQCQVLEGRHDDLLAWFVRTADSVRS